MHAPTATCLGTATGRVSSVCLDCAWAARNCRRNSASFREPAYHVTNVRTSFHIHVTNASVAC